MVFPFPPDIYRPMLSRLRNEGIQAVEKSQVLPNWFQISSNSFKFSSIDVLTNFFKFSNTKYFVIQERKHGIPNHYILLKSKTSKTFSYFFSILWFRKWIMSVPYFDLFKNQWCSWEISILIKSRKWNSIWSGSRVSYILGEILFLSISFCVLPS